MGERVANLLINIIWLAHRCLSRLTHRQKTPGVWTPRRWASSWLASHPWLWCRCGDSLDTWEEVRQRRCEVCLWLAEKTP